MAWLLKVAIFATLRFNNHVQIDLVDLIVKGGILATFNNQAQIYLLSTKDSPRKKRFDEKQGFYYQFWWGPGYICMHIHLIFIIIQNELT